MDFVEWCDRVLAALAGLQRELAEAPFEGISERLLAERLFGDAVTEQPEFLASERRAGLLDALEEMERLHWATAFRPGWWLATRAGLVAAAHDHQPFLRAVRRLELRPEEEQLLRLVNSRSARVADDHARVEAVGSLALLSALEWPDGVRTLQFAIEGLGYEPGLVRRDDWAGLPDQPAPAALFATYVGLIWEAGRPGL